MAPDGRDVLVEKYLIVHSYVTALNESAEKADFPQNLNLGGLA